MSYFFDPSKLKRKVLAPGVTQRTIWGERIMMGLVELAPHSTGSRHTHPNEQAGIVLQGELDFTIGGKTRRLRQGDAYLVPGGVEHGVATSDGWVLLMDVFSPPRDDYKS